MRDGLDHIDPWHDAAALAPFRPYEVDGGSERWAGGFAADGDQLEVITLVDGHEVGVETSRAGGIPPPHVARRSRLSHLLSLHVLEGDGEVTLPYSVTVEVDDRTVTVDGDEHVLHGMRIAGDERWVGTVELGEVSVTITTTSSAALALRPCTDVSTIPEFPPDRYG
jgi:hypothetical protein